MIQTGRNFYDIGLKSLMHETYKYGKVTHSNIRNDKQKFYLFYIHFCVYTQCINVFSYSNYQEFGGVINF